MQVLDYFCRLWFSFIFRASGGIILFCLVYLVLLGFPVASAYAARRVEGVSLGLAAVCLLLGREVSDLLWLLAVAGSLLPAPPAHPMSPCGEGGCFPCVLIVSGTPHQPPLPVVLGSPDVGRGAPLSSRAAYLGCLLLGCLLLLGWGLGNDRSRSPSSVG